MESIRVLYLTDMGIEYEHSYSDEQRAEESANRVMGLPLDSEESGILICASAFDSSGSLLWEIEY